MPRRKKKTQITILVFCSILALVLIGSFYLSRSTQSDQLLSTERNIQRAIVHCYALEGHYPPDIAYLEENYGVVINHEKYLVQYNAFGSNVMPEVRVREINKKG